ncbi:MAG: hypothetical protein HQL25_03110 [Candidatus Omnitrophica bacterium]|nr:hypothetical protein [Candidatus Omnitrophota bacterium]
MIWVFIIAIIGLVVIALILMLNKQISTKQLPADAVPISDINEIKELRQNVSKSSKPLSMSQTVDHLAHHLEVFNNERLPEITREIDVLKREFQTRQSSYEQNIQQLQMDNQKLEDALKREMSSREMKILAEEEKKLLKEKEEQLRMMREANIQLNEENKRLREEIIQFHKEKIDLLKKYDEIDQKLHEVQLEKEKLGNENRETQLRFDLIKMEVEKEFKQKVDEQFKIAEAQRIDYSSDKVALEKEYEKLTKFLEEIKAQKIVLENKCLSAENEIDTLRKQVEYAGKSSTAQVDNLKAEIVKLEFELDEKNREVSAVLNKREDVYGGINQAVDKVRDEYRNIVAERSKQVEVLEQGLKVLKLELERLEKENHGLVVRVEDTEKNNARFQERDRQLNYELVKARAQILGLERICNDYRIKVESLIKA